MGAFSGDLPASQSMLPAPSTGICFSVVLKQPSLLHVEHKCAETVLNYRLNWSCTGRPFSYIPVSTSSHTHVPSGQTCSFFQMRNGLAHSVLPRPLPAASAFPLVPPRIVKPTEVRKGFLMNNTTPHQPEHSSPRHIPGCRAVDNVGVIARPQQQRAQHHGEIEAVPHRPLQHLPSSAGEGG